ncbi:cell division protein [Janthinobacterium sp. 17J80-10]|uniref:cell division protein n=1 Tax=Janthinobacterium sp. 17J80-10 TaxID=2497863 RepID=UPI0010057D39|nr:cell division protein [Janthinobacterium sp. 17J80-10]
MDSITARQWLVLWMYATALVHLLVGMALPWIGDLPMFDDYHLGVEAAFWGASAPSAARAQQVWWIGLFGPTIQGMSLWMLALIHFGDRYRSGLAWGALIAGIVIWAPQDIWISLRADCWTHVWVDGFAVLTMVPPLAWLWFHDRRQIAALHVRVEIDSEAA